MMTCANGSPPLGLPWTNVSVSEDGLAFTRGIEISVGNPQQIFSLIPSMSDPDIWLYNVADCPSAKNDTCLAQKGGVYDRSLSTTFDLTTYAAWNGTHTQFTDGPYIFFNDELRFGSNGSSLGFPFLMNLPDQGLVSGLGLGMNSTFLSAAVASGSAPTEAFGLWVGSQSAADPVDGALWIGGYDENRVGGKFTEFRTRGGCLVCDYITNLTYNVPGMAPVSLFSHASEYLAVGFDPGFPFLEVPETIFHNFIKASNGTFDVKSNFSTYLPSQELGNLSVTLSDGYETVIPAKELFLPPQDVHQSGVAALNDTLLVGLISSQYVEAGYTPIWGLPFLTMNYLVADFANKSFKLAPAIQGSAGQSSSPAVRPLCTGLPQNTTTFPAKPVEHHSGTDVGAIAGGVVGGVVGLLAILLLGFFLLRTRRRQRRAKEEHNAAITPSQKPSMADGTSHYTGDSSPQTNVSEAPQTNVSEAPNTSVSEAPNDGLDRRRLHTEGQLAELPAMATVDKPFEMPAHPFD